MVLVFLAMVRTLLFGEAFDPWEAEEARAIQ